MSAEAARAELELRMVEAMVDCAHELALALGAAARAEAATRPMLALVEAFNRTFQAARLGIRLCMRLRAPPKAAVEGEAAQAGRPERDEAPEGAERPERPERLEAERDRDYEAVSLPKFLASLRAAAAAAGEMAGELPPHIGERTLPTLNELLAEAASGPDSPPPTPGGTDLLVRTAPPHAAARTRLLGSAAPPATLPRPPPRGSG